MSPGVISVKAASVAVSYASIDAVSFFTMGSTLLRFSSSSSSSSSSWICVSQPCTSSSISFFFLSFSSAVVVFFVPLLKRVFKPVHVFPLIFTTRFLNVASGNFFCLVAAPLVALTSFTAFSNVRLGSSRNAQMASIV